MGVASFLGRFGRKSIATTGRPQHESAQNPEKTGRMVQAIRSGRMFGGFPPRPSRKGSYSSVGGKKEAQEAAFSLHVRCPSVYNILHHSTRTILKPNIGYVNSQALGV